MGQITLASQAIFEKHRRKGKKERDPDMHQTRKGNQWYFGAKAHIGVDSKEGVVHSVCTSAASVSDLHMLRQRVQPR
jgi:IS5 family transposase